MYGVPWNLQGRQGGISTDVISLEVDTSRLKVEDYFLLPGSLVLLASIFLGWYSIGIGDVSGWDATRWSIALMVSALGGVIITVLTSIGVDFAEEYGVVLVITGLGSLAVAIVKIFVKQMGLQPTYGIYFAIAGAACLLVAGIGKLLRTGIILWK